MMRGCSRWYKKWLRFISRPTSTPQYMRGAVASVSAGTIVGLVGSESLSVSSVTGQFDSAAPGENKPVTVVYGLADGANGGLVSNYDWSPVTVSARIQNPSKEQKLNVAPNVTEPYTRVSYLGFGGVSGAAVAGTLRTPFGAAAAATQACSAARLEECLCEESQDPTLEICVIPKANDMK